MVSILWELIEPPYLGEIVGNCHEWIHNDVMDPQMEKSIPTWLGAPKRYKLVFKPHLSMVITTMTTINPNVKL